MTLTAMIDSGRRRGSAGGAPAAPGSDLRSRRPTFLAGAAVDLGLGLVLAIAAVAHAQPDSGARISEIEHGLALATPAGGIMIMTGSDNGSTLAEA